MPCLRRISIFLGGVAVAVLAPRARPPEPLDPEVRRRAARLRPPGRGGGLRQHGDGDSRGVDPSAAFVWRHPLHPVPASLGGQPSRSRALYPQGDPALSGPAGRAREAVALSAEPGGSGFVCAGKLLGEEERVVAALGGTDLDDD